MFEPYLMGQYQYPWQGMTPAPNWQPQTPQVAQGQQGIQGVRFVSGIEEAKNCTIPLGSKALQGQVNQLQLQSALCGVVRYPNSTTFTAGYNPYFNTNACGCGTTF